MITAKVEETGDVQTGQDLGDGEVSKLVKGQPVFSFDDADGT